METLFKFFSMRPWIKNGKCLVCFKGGPHQPNCPVRDWDSVVNSALAIEALKAAKAEAAKSETKMTVENSGSSAVLAQTLGL